MDHPGYWEVVLRAFLAILGGGVVGWQRELHDKPAGLRTLMMVGLGAAIFTIATLKFYLAMLAADEPGRIDPTRVFQGIAGGIGFLGAGTIIRAQGSVEGVTTAAAIWVVGAVGIACGLGYFFLAGLTVLFALAILSLVPTVERGFLTKAPEDNGES